jgi:prophage maintenance system killer protein
MRFIISKQALVYLLELFVAQSVKNHLPCQKEYSVEQIDKLFSIIKSSSTKVFGEVRYVTLIEKISHIVYEINKQHILTDGNKRFSLLVALYLMDEKCNSCLSKSDWEMLIMRIASDQIYTKEDVVEYLKEKLER